MHARVPQCSPPHGPMSTPAAARFAHPACISRAKVQFHLIRVKRPLTAGAGGPKIAGSLGLLANSHRNKFGGIPKRPTGADCKSAGLRLRWFESTSLHQLQVFQMHHVPPGGLTSRRRTTGTASRCGSSSMVEPQFSKLITRVRFPSPAPPLQLQRLARQTICSRSSVGRAPPW